MKATIDEALELGIAAHKQNKLEKAEMLYRAILKNQPAHPDANHNLGLILTSSTKKNMALPFFKTALESNPNVEQYWISYIDALIKGKQFANAQRVLEKGERQGVTSQRIDFLKDQLKPIIRPNATRDSEQKEQQEFVSQPNKPYIESQTRRGKDQKVNVKSPDKKHQTRLIEHYQKGRYAEAQKLALSLTDEFPQYALAWKILGVLFERAGRLSEALTVNDTLVSLSPQDFEAHYNQGITLKKLGKLEKAIKSYQRAVQLNSGFSDAHYNLASVLRKLGRQEEAEESYRQVIDLKSHMPEAHYHLALVLEELGRPEEAVKSYRRATKFKPDFFEAHFNLGGILRELGDFEEARISYEQAVASKSDSTKANINLGATLKELGRLDEAEAILLRAIASEPNLPEAHSNLANTLKEKGKLEEAEASYTKAIELRPNYVNALKNRGLLFFDKGDFKSALKDFDLSDTSDSRAYALAALYALGDIKNIYERIESHLHVDGKNLRVAAFSSFISEIQKKSTAHAFCKNPLEFLYFSNISSHCNNADLFMTEMIEELHCIENVWEPTGQTTKQGFQSKRSINLFENPSTQISRLKSVILDELNLYYAKFKNDSCSYIKDWPSGNNLNAWYVILKNQGYQGLHIHPAGWLSGVVYLKVVPPLEKQEGAIEFSLSGEHYDHIGSPKILFQPQLGDIVFFPSSLHHRTIPFTTQTDRIIISFDLQPR